MNNIDKAKLNFLKKEENLSCFATKSMDSLRIKSEE